MSDETQRPEGRHGIGETSRGVWTFTADVDLLRRLALSGFDWPALDGSTVPSPVPTSTRSVAPSGMPGTTFSVRVPAVDGPWIGAALDAGAATVVVPSVDGTADAVLAARASRYAPLGDRSWGVPAPVGSTRARSRDGERDRPVPRHGRDPRCLAEVDEIAATPGVDGLFVGPFDLALGLGTTVDALLDDHTPGNPIGAVVAAAQKHGILVGAFAGTPATARGCGRTASGASP